MITGCNPEDLPEAMNDRETWRERVRDIRAGRTTWWWWLSKNLSMNFWMKKSLVYSRMTSYDVSYSVHLFLPKSMVSCVPKASLIMEKVQQLNPRTYSKTIITFSNIYIFIPAAVFGKPPACLSVNQPTLFSPHQTKLFREVQQFLFYQLNIQEIYIWTPLLLICHPQAVNLYLVIAKHKSKWKFLYHVYHLHRMLLWLM